MSQDQIQLPEPDGYVWHEGRMAPSGGYEAGFGFSLSKPEEVEGAVFSHEVAPVYFAAPIRSLIERLEAAEKDAERYRWLRDSHPADGEVWAAMGIPNTPAGISCWRHEELDAAIDSAMAGGLAEGVSDA